MCCIRARMWGRSSRTHHGAILVYELEMYTLLVLPFHVGCDNDGRMVICVIGQRKEAETEGGREGGDKERGNEENVRGERRGRQNKTNFCYNAMDAGKNAINRTKAMTRRR